MKIHQGYENLNIVNPVVTLGIFDGVHLGHKALLASLVKKARDSEGEAVVITFYPHPRKVLSENMTSLTFLTSLDEKIALLEKEGVNHLIIIPFDHDFSNKEACEFIEEVLVKKIGARYLIAGYNHHFGRRGDSDFETIHKCAKSFNIIVEQVKALNTDKGIVSSSLIREALNKGDIETANSLLGYYYFINGSVVEGKKLGREIGYPTANIKPDYDDKLIPGIGIYAVEILIDGVGYKGMLSIGFNPTVNRDTSNRSIEVHIFDFRRDIYKSKILVIFREKMRDEKKFGNISLLAAQLELDKEMALRILK